MQNHTATEKRTRLQKAIEREYGRPWWEVLGELLYERRYSQERAAKRLGVTRRTVGYWARDPRVENKQAASAVTDAA